MTREDAIKQIGLIINNHSLDVWQLQALTIALSALRPVSREQVEKVWRGEWKQDKNGQVVCNRCGAITAIGSKAALHNANEYDRFCFSCGAPMTDEAVQMVMERLEAPHGDL